MNANWEYPPPRSGLIGQWDRLIGPGATKAETSLILGFGVLFGIIAPLHAWRTEIQWNFWQWIIVVLLAFDLAGGIVANATSTAKRWYQREGQGFSAYFGFTALHIIYILLIAWLFRGSDWIYFFGLSFYLLIAAAIVLRIPLYLQRPSAFTLYAGAVFLSLSVFAPTPGVEWFIPFLFLKLLVSHLLREAPYTSEIEA